MASATCSFRELLVSRIIGGTFLALALSTLLLIERQQMVVGVILILPIVVGALVAVIANDKLTGKVESCGSFFQRKRDEVTPASGVFARWFKRPLYAGLAFVWQVTGRLGYRHLRGFLQTTLGLYFAAFMLNLLYSALSLLVALAILLVIFWVAGRVLGWWKPGLDAPNDSGRPDAPGIVAPGRTYQREGVLQSHAETYDEHGNKVLESRKFEGVAQDYTEHRNKQGDLVVTSRTFQGVAGPHTEYRDVHGDLVAVSRTFQGVAGPYTECRDKEGNLVSESRLRAGVLGAYEEHEKE